MVVGIGEKGTIEQLSVLKKLSLIYSLKGGKGLGGNHKGGRKVASCHDVLFCVSGLID